MGAAPGKPTIKLAGGRKNPQEEPFTRMVSSQLNTQNQGRGYTGGTKQNQDRDFNRVTKQNQDRDFNRVTNNRGSF